MSMNVAIALRAILLADAGVAGLVSTRVFVAELPRAEAALMPRQCVVITPSGGAEFQPGSFIRHSFQRLDAFAYGATPFDADLVRDAVYDALVDLGRNVTSNTLIHWVQSAGGWATNRDTDARWPMSFQSFQAFYARDAAA